jgi:Tol biopolymer transport system component
MGFPGSAVAAIAATMAMLLSFAPWAQATVPGKNGKIAVNAASVAGGGIHVVNADGTGVALVIRWATDPAWSADGSRLAYFDPVRFPGALLVANADGSDETLLREATESFDGFVSRGDVFREPAWSPDASTIAYEESDLACAPRVGCNDDPEGIRTIRPDGTGDRQLLETAAADPAYSPDGTKIAWNHHRLFATGIHVSNADGTGDTQLTTKDPVTGNGAAFDPSWSPDGTRIVFAKLTSNSAELFVMNSDGTNQTRLTFSEAADDVDPAWSPDGTKIAWSRDYRLWVMNADGSGQGPVSSDLILASRPDWQPLVGPRRADYKNASHFCKAEREFLGEQEFGQKYGNHGGCVTRNR